MALLDHVDWPTGHTEPLTVNIGLSVQAIYQRLSASQASLGGPRSYGDLLLVILLIISGLFLIIEVGALVMGLALARSITGAIHELFAGTERVRQGDFGHRIPVLANDQLGELANSFNQMTGSIEDLLRQAAEKKRLEEEMRLAREIQMSLLPRGPLLVPGLTISALCVPAREVGGDYYDVLALPDGRYGVLIADVSGKGMSAALYMAELKGLILSLSQIHLSPRDLLISANRLISMHLDSRSFITMTYAVIDPVAGVMTYARAGHTPMLYLPAGNGSGSRASILAPDGLVLGLRIDDGERFASLLAEVTLRILPGDLLVLFTDGISEAMNEHADCFGETQLAELVEEHGHLPIGELRERILREITAFVGGAPQHDDMTMILLKVDAAERRRGGSMSGPVVVFRAWSDIEANIVRGLLEAHGIDVSVASDLAHTVFPLTMNGLGEVRIAVSGDDADAATRLIQDFRTSDEGGPPARIRDEFEALQEAAGYRFRDRGILEHALTHRSRANEDVTGGVADNESLEFLGDAVLGFVVAEFLFTRFPDRDEGQKSKMKAALVSTPALARQAGRLGLGEHLLLGRGEEKTGGRRKRALLADGFEALIAAIYLDGGMDAARAFILREFEPFVGVVAGRRDHRRRPQVGVAGDAPGPRRPAARVRGHGRGGPGAPPALQSRSPRARERAGRGRRPHEEGRREGSRAKGPRRVQRGVTDPAESRATA